MNYTKGTMELTRYARLIDLPNTTERGAAQGLLTTYPPEHQRRSQRSSTCEQTQHSGTFHLDGR